jgi:phenylacetate-CoA ligase
MLEYLAKEVLSAGIKVPVESVRTAWNGGEMLFQGQVSAFQSAFGVPILNAYGGRELGAMAYEGRSGEPLQVLLPWLFVEIVDENGRPVEPGEPGRMLWTSTICRGTPFLRYEIGDLAIYDATGKDEAGIFALRELQGRVGSVFHLPDGTQISALYWNHFWKEFSEVKQFQVILQNDSSIEILLKGTPFSGEREAYCRKVLGITLKNVSVDLKWVPEIPKTPQGKLVQVIRRASVVH